MSELKGSYRLERIKRLLDELRYEVERGMMDREIDSETLVYRWVVPHSSTFPNRQAGVICEFRTRPVVNVFDYLGPQDLRAVGLQVIKGGMT